MRSAAIVLVAAAMCWPVAAAQAAFPGADGRIAYQTGVSDLHSINPDGSGLVDLGPGRNAAWSPDGLKIAFDLDTCAPTPCNRDIWVMNADGSGRTRVTTEASFDEDPSWSPDGQRIAFISNLNGGFDVWTMNADGTGRTKVTDDIPTDTQPAWSPDGTRIAFGSTNSGRLSVVNIDGTDRHFITPPGSSQDPNWSPDATKIVYVQNSTAETVNPDGTGAAPVPNGSDVGTVAWSPSRAKFVFGGDTMDTMNVDGTNRVTIVSSANFPDWQPIVTGYPRPKGATPMYASLVVAYPQCASPNRTHGPPLAFGSCAPPVPASPSVNVGTPLPDGSGAAANMIGSVRYDVIPGVPGPPDDSDVSITASITDVRCDVRNINIFPFPCGPPNSLQQNDYIGELQASVGLRITDKWNDAAPGGGTDAATVADTALEVTVPCLATPSSPGIGGTCAVSTSADALAPGTVLDTKRAIWQMEQVRVFDAGPDGLVGTPDGRDLFAAQGVLIP